MRCVIPKIIISLYYLRICGLLAKVTTYTRSTPAVFKTRAISRIVAPVVHTSSMTKTFFGKGM
ncbi:MAG: hypothetical protein UZ22_OP11002000962 [Microgenomates bacterium OLB23]|nr:MAG: hypothetical protein UZ22_OP11002000962 [Microgenomates bacterium OLB23]